MRTPFPMALLLLAWAMPAMVFAGEAAGSHQLHHTLSAALESLPADSHLLLDPKPIEEFLAALDGFPPNWSQVYGHGHHDPGHDDRLFALNRQRDALREGKAPLGWVIIVAWLGELSRFDEVEGGFRVVLGPKFIRTAWGEVRFKHEDLPATLIASAGAATGDFQARMQRGERIEIDVLLCGRLIPEESLVYDFSHEVEGLGLIMPVVRVEDVAFVVAEQGKK